MIPTVLLVGVALGRWWWQVVLGAAVGWPLVVLGVGAINPSGIPLAAALGAANAAVGVAANRVVAGGMRAVEHVELGPGVIGGALWVGVVGLALGGVGDLTLVDALLLLAVLCVVPLAVPLVPAWSRTPHAPIALVAGLPLAAALLIERGPVAGLLALPWLLATLVGAMTAAAWWWRTRPGWAAGAWVVAPAYLVVGAAWLLADRLDLAPAGVTAPLVQLTAIHFHHAGFGAAVLATCTWQVRPSRGAGAALAMILAGPPVVAVGFLTSGVLQVLGALLLAVGLWALAWQVVRHVAPRFAGAPRILLVVSALATLAPMVLAVQWAAGSAFGTPALSIPAMALWHGLANAVGFVLLGVLGWRLAALDRPDPGGAAELSRTR